MSNSTNVLLIEDSPVQAEMILKMLESDSDRTVLLVSELADGLARLDEGGIDVVLADLGLPDSEGLETVTRLRARAPEIPIVVLTGLDDEDVATTALQQGAQDYLIKAEVDANWLTRSLRYAVTRHKLRRVAGTCQEPVAQSVEPVESALGVFLQVEKTGGTCAEGY